MMTSPEPPPPSPDASDASDIPFASMPQAIAAYHCVYILRSVRDPERYYTGRCEDMSERLVRHNRGAVVHTAEHRPWIVHVAILFRERDRAIQLERYLKSGSGRSFAKKRL